MFFSYLAMNLVNMSKAVLDKTLPNRYKGRGSSFVNWPPRPRDLSVFDFLMGVFEGKCYPHDIATDYEFMRIIEEELW